MRDSDVVVVGSAPLPDKAYEAIQKSQRLICVNGSTSSVKDKLIDVWVLNSRQYDDSLYTDPTRWPTERKHLHEQMLIQTKNRSVRHICFLQKSKNSDQTIAKLKAQNVRWRGQTELHTGQKTDLVCRAGVKRFSIAFNISAGLFGACLALVAKAKTITLCGFSYHDKYAYLAETLPNTRKHIEQDQEALSQLLVKHSDRLQILWS